MNGTPLLTTEQAARAVKEDYTEQELETTAAVLVAFLTALEQEEE